MLNHKIDAAGIRGEVDAKEAETQRFGSVPDSNKKMPAWQSQLGIVSILYLAM